MTVPVVTVDVIADRPMRHCFLYSVPLQRCH